MSAVGGPKKNPDLSIETLGAGSSTPSPAKKKAQKATKGWTPQLFTIAEEGSTMESPFRTALQKNRTWSLASLCRGIAALISAVARSVTSCFKRSNPTLTTGPMPKTLASAPPGLSRSQSFNMGPKVESKKQKTKNL